MSEIYTKPFNPITWGGSPHDFTSQTGGDHGLQLGPFAIETTQRHVYGRRLLTWDGKVYKYCLSSGACRTFRGAKHMDVIGTVGIDWVILPVGRPVGSRQITVTAAVAQAEDSLAGGTMIISDEADADPTDGHLQMRTIVGNTACAGGGTTIITLDYPLNLRTTVAVYIWCMPSMYKNVAFSTTAGSSVAGIPAAYVSATGYNFWVQTWGPCSCAMQATGSGPGGGHGHDRQLVWRHDGTMDYRNNASATGGVTYEEHQQMAGYGMDNNTSNNGISIIMLQVSI